jgi:Domain of unknown function (DUF4340)
MDSSSKLYISVAVLAVLGGGLYFQSKSHRTEEKAYSYAAKMADLPTLDLKEETLKAVDRIELTLPAKVAGEKSADGTENTENKPAEAIVLSKVSEERWDLTSPVQALANASNVKALLDNVKTLKVVEPIATSPDTYDRWGVTEAKGLHVVLKKGNETVLDMYFGDDGSRGQMSRIAGKDGVFAIKGYTKFAYSRDAKGWRDRGLFKFDDKEATRITVENEHGGFEFTKGGDAWAGTFKKGNKGAAKSIEKFKASKVEDLLRAYKGLNAAEFGEDKKASEVGLEPPKGVLTIELKDGAKQVVQVGDTSEGTNRWVKVSGHEGIYSISSWASDWVVGDVSRYQETPPKADKPAAEADE